MLAPPSQLLDIACPVMLVVMATLGLGNTSDPPLTRLSSPDDRSHDRVRGGLEGASELRFLVDDPSSGRGLGPRFVRIGPAHWRQS